MTIIVEKAKSKEDYIRAWTEGMRHLARALGTNSLEFYGVSLNLSLG